MWQNILGQSVILNMGGLYNCILQLPNHSRSQTEKVLQGIALAATNWYDPNEQLGKLSKPRRAFNQHVCDRFGA